MRLFGSAPDSTFGEVRTKLSSGGMRARGTTEGETGQLAKQESSKARCRELGRKLIPRCFYFLKHGGPRLASAQQDNYLECWRQAPCAKCRVCALHSGHDKTDIPNVRVRHRWYRDHQIRTLAPRTPPRLIRHHSLRWRLFFVRNGYPVFDK